MLANEGGAVDVFDQSLPDFVNCIFWNNTANQGKQISVSSSGCVLDINYCDVSGGEEGIGPYGIGASGTYENNLDEDPLFLAPLAYDYHIPIASPCHNAGDPEILDPDGSISDIGCFFAWDPVSIDDAPVMVSEIKIYPNPVSNSCSVSFNLVSSSLVKIEVFNYTGQKVLSMVPEKQQEGLVTIPVDIDLLTPGSLFAGFQLQNQSTPQNSSNIKIN